MACKLFGGSKRALQSCLRWLPSPGSYALPVRGLLHRNNLICKWLSPRFTSFYSFFYSFFHSFSVFLVFFCSCAGCCTSKQCHWSREGIFRIPRGQDQSQVGCSERKGRGSRARAAAQDRGACTCWVEGKMLPRAVELQRLNVLFPA